MNDVAGLVERLFWAHERPMTIEQARAAADALQAQAAEIERLREERKNAQSTLSAWFDLSKKAEEAGASILAAALDTWLHRAAIGGMPSKHADIVRNVVGEAARLYLWNALVPVLRTITDERAEVAEAKVEAQAAEIERLQKSLKVEMVAYHPLRTRAEAAEAKLREAVEVVRRWHMADLTGHDGSLSRVRQVSEAFLVSMEKTDDPQ